MVCGWYWLLDAETVSVAPMGFYGVHTSLLPEYRGGSPLIWSIINGDAEVGATVFRLASGVDDGEILHQVRVLNLAEDNVGTILEKIERGMVDTLPAKWRLLLAGRAELMQQDHARATFCGQRAPRDGRIDWTLPATRVHNFIRAQTAPYPGAFDHLDGKKIVFLKTAVDDRHYFGTPGQVLQRSKNNVLISCGSSSAISVLELEVDGSRVSPSKALPSVTSRLGI
jgi:methionyl-tRNA formyltransferase